MTRTLVLIRHAKSDWNHDDLDDHDRPLNARGYDSAPRIGAWLADRGVMPDHVLCSTARRAQETWAGVARRLPGAPSPELVRALYLATPDVMLTRIRATDAPCLALVGHNPGIGSLAHALCQSPPDHEKFGLYPTGATLILRFDGPPAPGAGEVVAFGVPREMADPS